MRMPEDNKNVGGCGGKALPPRKWEGLGRAIPQNTTSITVHLLAPEELGHEPKGSARLDQGPSLGR